MTAFGPGTGPVGPVEQVNPEKPEKPGKPGNGDGERPEALRYLLFAWAIMVGGELVHQLFGVAVALFDPSALMQSAREANKSIGGEAVTEDQVKLIVYVSIVLMGLFALAVVLLLALALKAVAERKTWVRNAAMLLVVFSVFFVLRMVTVFLVVGANTEGVPTAVVALDGVIQIIAGVAAVCGLIFAYQDDVKRWTAKRDAKDGRGNHNDSHPVA